MAGEAASAANGGDRAWFADGLYEVLAGVVILLYAALFIVSKRQPWTVATAVAALAALAWLTAGRMEILLWAKRRLVFPRVGRQRPPPWLVSDPQANWIRLGLSGRAAPVRPARPISHWRLGLAAGGAVAGGLLPFAWLRTPAAYLLAGVAVSACLLVAARPVGAPWRLALLIVLWSLALWRWGPAPATAATLALWFGGLGGCAILAGAVSLLLFLWSYPPRRGTANDC